MTDDKIIEIAKTQDGLERFTLEALRKWGEELDAEAPRGLGERLICFADSWAVAILAEREACALACFDALDDEYIDFGESCANRIRWRTNEIGKGMK